MDNKEVGKGSWLWRIKSKFIIWLLKTFYKEDSIVKDVFQAQKDGEVHTVVKNIITIGKNALVTHHLTLDAKNFEERIAEITMPQGKKVE